MQNLSTMATGGLLRFAPQQLIAILKKCRGFSNVKNFFKGNVIVLSRFSKKSLYDMKLSTFEDDGI